jgi:hypothetical protein
MQYLKNINIKYFFEIPLIPCTQVIGCFSAKCNFRFLSQKTKLQTEQNTGLYVLGPFFFEF